MGCRPSKVDDLPLVIRCRERKRLIKSAADYRYDLSSSHLAYFHSLRDIGFALSRFVDEQLVIPSPSPSSPVLTLPSDQGKTKNNGSMSSGSISHIHSIDGGNGDSESDLSSSLDGHIHLHDSGGFENEKPRSSSHNRPHHYNELDSNDPYVMNREPPPYQPPWGPNQTNFSDPYAMNRGQQPYQPPWGDPYVVNPSAFPYQPPWGPNQTSWGENDPYVMNPSASQYQPPWGAYQENFDSHNEYGGNPNSNQYASYMKKSAPATRTVIQPEEARGFQETRQWPDPSQYNPYGYGFSYGGAPVPPPQEPEKPKSPPPPPPPKDSDYLNFFDAYDNGYPGYGYGYGSMVSSPDSSEVREREGIPDLEEETETESNHDEVLKRHTTNNIKRNLGEGTSRSVGLEDNVGSSWREHSRRIPPRKSEMETHDEATLNSVASENNEGAQSVEIEVDRHSPETVVSQSMGEGYEGKKGVSFDVDEESIHEIESSMLSSLTTLSVHGSRDLQEVVNEIKDEFEVAFGYGKEVALMLEAGKLPYQSRFAVLKVVLSKILYPLASSEHPIQSVRSCSRVTKLAGSYNVDAVPNVRSINLSSTLEKLYVWEKKLYKEVKDEERLRVMYEKMYKRLNELDANGAESSKIDAAQASIRRLMTKLNVSIKAIDAISTEIHKVRDKELQPQVSDLIYGLIRMWQAIVKCHRKQFEALMESRSRTLRTNTTTTSIEQASNSRAVVDLETGLVTWSQHFNNWINAQKSYIDSLNGWLNQCIDHQPELTIDGVVPYSPARLGAPPIFIICNDWHREIKSVSQDRVSKAIHGFASNLRQLMERQDDVQRIMVKNEYHAKDLAGIRKKTGGGLPEKMSGPMVPSESGVVEEEWARHKEAMKLVAGGGGLSSLQGGVIPIFRALETFTCDALKAHEQVRLQG
ncbi:hypothetical protein Lser_V15G19220 [Lactuca serriola]